MRYGYTILYVPDVSATVDFYERAFGLERRFVDPNGQYAELETGPTTLAFAATDLIRAQGLHFRDHGPAGLPAAMEIGLTTDDVPTAVERAVQEGARLVAAPVTKPWGQVVAYVSDPDGVLVELCTPMG
ncbi:MAG: lactoylglutathione lyase [Dehalococcoidia bacterium]|nr:MAG: lactoylglutathione lyase [Dehalococcoidia bacterium]